MGLPSIDIIFKSKAIAAIQQGSVGVLAMVLKDAGVAALTNYMLTDVTEIPATLTAANQQYLNNAFIGTPKSIKVSVIPDNAADYTTALDYLETIQWNIGCIPGIADADTTTVASWVKSMRDAMERKVIMALPHSASDYEGIINVTTDDIKVGSNTYTASQYSARVAGLVAGLPLTVAPTYQVFTEVDDVPHLKKADAGAAIDAGEFILYHDGVKVKVGRGITSLVTTTEDKGADWKKIKLVRIFDKVYTDVKGAIEDEYIGKVQNSYTNKLLLIAAINAYYETLEQANVLDSGKNLCQINASAQKTYLKSIDYTTTDGRDVTQMTDQEIKEANTDDKVFLTSTIKALDAIEDVSLEINI